MSDQSREFRVVDYLGNEWDPGDDDRLDLERAKAWATYAELSNDAYAPFRIESRQVTDWQPHEPEQPADSATGCQTTEASAP